MDNGVVTYFYVTMALAVGVGMLAMAAIHNRRKPARWVPLGVGAMLLAGIVIWFVGPV